MALSLKPDHLKRYAAIARLLMKYGRSDLVRDSGLIAALTEEDKEKNGQATADPKAEELADDLEKMGPIYVKMGQLLSTRVDLLPDPYIKALTRLQDKVDPFPSDQIEEMIEEEIGARISKAFSRFDREPIASASLGQVYRAALRDGREVVVKVQRPGVRKDIADDLEALAEIAEFLDNHTEAGRRYHYGQILEEFGKNLARELDYRQEAKNLQQVGDNLREFKRIVIPRPIESYTTSRVLTMEYIHGKKITDVGPLGRMEMNGGALGEHLFRAYLQQILIDGIFHADPHPGNVFLTDDGNIALLDLGMVGHISPRMQDDLLRLLAAISNGRSDEASDLAIKLGHIREEDFDEVEYRRRTAALVTDQQNATLGDIEIGRIVMEVTRTSADYGVDLPSEFTMLGKTLLNLDEVARSLDPKFDPNESIRRNIGDVMQKRLVKSATSGNLATTFLETKEFVEQLPARVNKILDAVANNEIAIKVDAIDEKKLLDGFQKVANRITVGLVIAALIVGAAMLMRVETSFQIAGYPGLAILCFIAAAAAGFWMVISVLITDREARKKK